MSSRRCSAWTRCSCGCTTSDERLAAVLRAAAGACPMGPRCEDAATEAIGIGIAAGVEKDGRVASCVQVRMEGEEL